MLILQNICLQNHLKQMLYYPINNYNVVAVLILHIYQKIMLYSILGCCTTLAIEILTNNLKTNNYENN